MIYQSSSINALLKYNQTLNKFGVVNLDMDDMIELIDFATKYGAIDVCIAGSNPSQASVDNTPFHKGTKSRRTIDSWLEHDDGAYCLTFENIVDYKTKDNKPLKKSEIVANLPRIKDRFSTLSMDYKIVAVGKTAQEALELAGVEHFKMWHPSGLNHLWNDKEAGEAKIKEMLMWLKN